MNPYARCGRSDPIREKIQSQPNTLEDVLEHCNQLERQYVLSAIVSDFKHSLLPDVILAVCLLSFALSNCVRIDVDGRLDLANFESRHEWGLSNYSFKTQTQIMRENKIHLSMTLQRTTRFSVDIDDLTLWVTRKVNPNM